MPNPADVQPSPKPPPGRPRRIAYAHDWLVGFRGGEAVLERLTALPTRRPDLHLQAAPLYTMFHTPGALSSQAPATDALHARVSWLNRFPTQSVARRGRRWLLPMYPFAVGGLSRALAHDHAREPIDLLLSTSSAAIKGLRPPAGVPHLCYCHSPARYLWDRTDQYGGDSIKAKARSAGLGLFGPRLRSWDRRTATHVTRFVANSKHTAALIQRAYDRDATVIHPPARTAYFTPAPHPKREDFWLVVAALEPYKRTDLAIDAALHAGARLIIAGEGGQRAELEARAADAPAGQITFTGRVSDERLRELYRTARLLVFPQVEDFGIVAVEAQAAGCPVVARAEGGALDTVVDGVTGALFTGSAPEALAEAADRAPEHADTACARHAQAFGETAFDNAMAAQIEDLLTDAQKR
ncbi:MAG: glycosyltransferase [Planctomycetota bacterium]